MASFNIFTRGADWTGITTQKRKSKLQRLNDSLIRKALDILVINLLALGLVTG
jgi:hypothetical protein